MDVDLSAPVVVHSPGLGWLSDGVFAGELPVMAKRWVGDVSSWEPTVGVGPDGTAFYMASTTAMRSRDQGLTWQDVQPREADVLPMPLISGDPFLHVDPTTGRVWVALVDLCHDPCPGQSVLGGNEYLARTEGDYARAAVGVQLGGTGLLERFDLGR